MKHYLIPIFYMYFSEFQKFISAKLFGISKFLAITLKGTVNTFYEKKQRCPKSNHKLPISPFSKYHKIPSKSNNFTIFTHFFFEKFEKPKSPPGRFNPCAQNEYSFHQNFTKPQPSERGSVKHYLIPIFYIYFSEFSKMHQRQTIWNFKNFLLSP